MYAINMSMIRPDQFRYDQFCRHLEKIDDKLRIFCHQHDFMLIKNQHRQPARDLKRVGVPMLNATEPHQEFIGVYLEEHWCRIDWQEDMLHTFVVAAYYKPRQGKRLYKRCNIVEHLPFSVMQSDLECLLAEGLSILGAWSPPIVTADDPDAHLQGWQRTFA